MGEKKRQTAFRISEARLARLKRAAELDNRGHMTAALEEAIDRYCDQVERQAKKEVA